MKEEKETKETKKEKIKLDTIYDKLAFIQQNLTVGKEQYNNFGKFSYRTVSDILIAVKPLLDEAMCVLILTDEVVNVGDRIYVHAKARLIDAKTKEEVCVDAYAREAETQSGMGASQLTGGASTYSRKYALNGLLAIDDTVDPDAANNKAETEDIKVDLKTGEVEIKTESATKRLTKLVKKEEK